MPNFPGTYCMSLGEKNVYPHAERLHSKRIQVSKWAGNSELDNLDNPQSHSIRTRDIKPDDDEDDADYEVDISRLKHSYLINVLLCHNKSEIIKHANLMLIIYISSGRSYQSHINLNRKY